MQPEHDEGQILHISDKGQRTHVRVELVRAVFNLESQDAPQITYYKNAQFDLDWQSWSSYKRVFEANKIPLIPVFDTRNDPPVSGFLSANFASVVEDAGGVVPVLRHDMSNEWFIPVNEQGEPMTHAELQEFGVKCPEPEAVPA